MRPAGTAVLGQVLVEGMGEVRFSLDVGPGEGIGGSGDREICVRKGDFDNFFDGVTFQYLIFTCERESNRLDCQLMFIFSVFWMAHRAEAM